MGQEIALAASGLAAALIFIAFLIYNLRDGRITTGTWVILAIGDGLDFGSYFTMTDQDIAMNIVPFCFAVGSIITFLVALVRRRFECPDTWDMLIIVADVVITVLWLQAGDVTATSANLAYQATGFLAFIPMYRGLARGTERELPLPWALWSTAFALFLLTYLLKGGSWEEGVFPIVGLATHLIVLRFALCPRPVR